MNILGAFQGDYIAAVEFNGRTPTFTIDHVKIVELEDDKGVKKRPVVYFSETKRGWVLCKTSALALAAMFTPETNTWTGKRVTLFETAVQVGPEKKPGIRVKGSPDLNADVVFDLKLPRKKMQQVRLVKTGDAKAPAAPPPPPPEPVIDPETGEKW